MAAGRHGDPGLSVAVIIAVSVNTDGRREVLGMTIGASEAETFWTEFLRQLARRGLRGVKLVISDAHEGIKAAVSKIFTATPPGPAGPVSCRDRMNGLLAIHG
jgi:transposase-like protein